MREFLDYNTISWDENRKLFALTLTDTHGVPFKLYLSEEATMQMIEDIEKDYCKRHGCQPFDTDEVIYVIEYCDIAGSGIEYVTTKEHEAIARWKEITEAYSSNPIWFSYSEYTNGVRKTLYMYSSQNSKK